jgi:pilus assembly protein Flp/PilA
VKNRAFPDFSAAARTNQIHKSLAPRGYHHGTDDWHCAIGQHACKSLEETSMFKMLSRFVSDESGVTAIEYGLIASLVAVVIIGAVTLVGTNLSATFQTVAAKV